MAHKNNNVSGERSRIRFMLVDFDGPSTDLQQLAQTFVQAVKIPAPATPTVAALPGPSGAAATRQNGEERALFGGIPTEEPATVQGEAQTETQASPSPAKTRIATRRKLTEPSLVEGLDCTSGPKPLKDYLAEVEPDGHAMRYLAIAQWLKEHRGVAEVGADHIYTCYRSLELPCPPDILGVFRGLNKRQCVIHGSAAGLYKLTIPGENRVTKARTKV